MNLLGELCKRAPNRVFSALLVGALAGVLNAFLIPLVLSALSFDPNAGGEHVPDLHRVLGIEVAHFRFACAFLPLCAALFVARLYARVVLIRVSMNFATDLRITLSRMIAAAPIARQEGIGPAALAAVLTEDVNRIVTAAQTVPSLLTNAVTLAGTLGFLYYLNGDAFRIVLGAILFGILTYQIPAALGARLFRRSRGIYDAAQEAVRGLIYGAKELKLDARKRRSYFAEVLVARERALLKVEKQAYTSYIAAATYGDLVGFLVIGMVAFTFMNYYSLSTQELIGIVMALLYVAGPVSVIMTALPEVTIARTSMGNIARLLGKINSDGVPDLMPPAPPRWQRLTLAEVRYQHASSARHEGYAVGPLSVTIERGQVAFLVGGNGSGKSTAGKLISLHYQPCAGVLAFDGVAVDDANVESYRQSIGAIYSDYHLFDRLLRPYDAQAAGLAERYLSQLGLEGKVSIADGVFSTLRLSDGQKRRLALLVALLDDKDLYVFDEWAADQDPSFKEVFYRQIVPELKRQGKAIVVISHDDRFFDVADQLLVMEDGRLRGTPAPGVTAVPVEHEVFI